jgi:phenylalanyl-tRNA synthetase beta chain
MKVTLNWLRQHVDFDWSPAELGERLTMLGLEVEGLHTISGEFEGVVVAQVVSREKHPNADKLSLCRVNDGKGERQIVCGAQNFKAGDKVPLILPGATLPPKPGEAAPFAIKVGKIRGVESHGMLCSPQELGLPDEVDGLLILPQDAAVGQPFAAHLGRPSGDVVLDLEVTPNRPDLNSVIGIAREISALTGAPLRMPEIAAWPEEESEIGSWLRVENQEPELCPRYTARLVRGVKVGPSPDWLRSTLEKVGVRSINNVVDVTNFILMELGQPLHAFDYHLLGAEPGGTPRVVIRRAAEGEEFTTLDGQARKLSPEALLIADGARGVALAGIMGGLNSEINSQTVDVLIESAHFKPQSIRATSKKMELRTESSYRFERGGDAGICDYASRRAAALITQLAGGKVVRGAIDSHPNPASPRLITLEAAKTGRLLGVEIPAAEQARLLNGLGVASSLGGGAGAETIESAAPTWRVDLKRDVDLIEEVARLFGVDKIPSTPPRGVVGRNEFDRVYDEIAEARRILLGFGMDEATGQTLVSSKFVAELLGAEAGVVALENPLSSDMDCLRPTLLAGLLTSLSHNAHHQVRQARLFEVGRVFLNTQAAPSEERRVALVVTGERDAVYWSGKERGALHDIYDLKGILEEFLEAFGLRGVGFSKGNPSGGLFLESGVIQLGKLPLGVFGQVNPLLARKLDLRDPVFAAELNLGMLLARRNAARSLKPLAAFPGSRRDIAMVVDDAVTHDAVLLAVKQAKPENLEGVELFDVYRGKGVPEGRKSLAYAFTYRHAERTLTEAEITAAHGKVAARLKEQLNASLRE